jgi:hypothetical protein
MEAYYQARPHPAGSFVEPTPGLDENGQPVKEAGERLAGAGAGAAADGPESPSLTDIGGDTRSDAPQAPGESAKAGSPAESQEVAPQDPLLFPATGTSGESTIETGSGESHP